MAKAAKRKKVIKRVYESGRETTLSQKRSKQSQSAKPKPKPKPTRSTIPLVMRQKTKAKKKIPRPAVHIQEQPQAVQAQTATAVSQQQYNDQQDLSWSYGTTYLTLMAKDPSWLYAYWEIAPDSLHALMKKVNNHHLKDAKTILRMYDVTLLDFNGSNANNYFDIEVGPHSNDWYINLWSDSVSYMGEIGLRLNDGRFFALVRSNAVHTPRKNHSPRNEHMWMKVTDEADHKPYVVARTNTYRNKKSLPAPKTKRDIYLSDEDIRRYYSNLNPLLRDIISNQLDKMYGEKVGKHKFILEDGSNSSVLPEGFFVKKVESGASESLVFLGSNEQASEQTSSASESLVKPDKRKFFFELNTEVIVYGRTQADAEVWLGDKKIPLRNDGTFSLRLALPDGNLPLEFKAEASDKKETRKINTYVERITYYK